MEQDHLISSDWLSIETINSIISKNKKIRLSEEARALIEKSRTFLEEKLQSSGEMFYGVNTGFGSLCNIRIDSNQIDALQYNLVVSHASGLGDEVPGDIIKLILLLKIQSLSYGHSGIQLKTVLRLIDFFNESALPQIFELGSLGASGDLAPLAHLSLPLIGKGAFNIDGKLRPAIEVLKEKNWSPLHLHSKEGLALLNGTQFTTAYALSCVIKAQKLLLLADMCASLSNMAYLCRTEPFEEIVHRIRCQPGQMQVAKNIRKWISQSNLNNIDKPALQDPYAFRCAPQVHGASVDAVKYISSVVLNEANSVTDNPNVFPDEDVILSGGNFHAQPIAIALDFLCIAVAEIGSISERRVYQLLSGSRGLPNYLIEDAGLQSGLMMTQYTAASIVSQNKQLCTPASVDSIVSSNGQEDHVSMGANAATKAYRLVKNVERLMAIEFMVAVQAVELRKGLKLNGDLKSIVQSYREVVPTLIEDKVLSPDMRRTIEFIRGIF